MAPSKDTCPTCKSAFFGRQKNLKCVGPCGFRYHLDCANLGETEYDFYMEGGTSSYKCEKCISASKSSHGDNTPVRPKIISSPKKIISPTRELKLPSLHSEESLSVQLETVRLNSVSIIDTVSTILEYVKELEKEMKELKSENAALKIQMAEILILNKDSSLHKPTQQDLNLGQQSTKSYSSVLSENVKQAKSAMSKNSLTHLASNSKANEVSVPTICNSDITITQSSNKHQIDTDGFQLVSKPKKKGRIHRVGTLSSSKLEMAPERVKTKALFVSRFSPKVNANNIEDSLKHHTNLRLLSVSKLKTKYQTYSSFHISVDERDFEFLNNPEVWPTGCLIAPFYGKLKSEQLFAPSNTIESVDSKVDAS